MDRLQSGAEDHPRHSSLPYPMLQLGHMKRQTTGPYVDSDFDSFREAIPFPSSLGTVIGRVRQGCLVACLLLGLLISCLDTSIVSTSLVEIADDFKSYVKVPWAVLSYLLTYMGCAVFIAKLSDLYGRRNLLLISWTIFVLFSWCCGLASSMNQLIIFRAFQGLGGSGLYTLTQVGMVEIGPSQHPGLIGALIGGTLAVSFVLGPILGGVITHLWGWRWIFNINMPVGLATIMGIVFCWPPDDDRKPFWQTFKSIDFLGGFSIFCATTLLVFGLQQGGSEAFLWSSDEVIVAMVLAGLFWVVFFGWQIFLGYKNFLNIQPIFPLRLLFRRVYIGAFFVSFCTGFCYIALVVTIPERFQIIKNEDPLMAGVHLLPMLGACAFSSFMAGAVCSKRNNSGPLLIASSALQIIGVGLLSTINSVDSDVRAQYGYQTIFGLGCGASFGAATIIAAVESALHGDLASAQGAICQVRVLGGCIGVAICTVIFHSCVNDRLRSHLTDDKMAELRQDPKNFVNLNPEDAGRVQEVYAISFAEEAKVMVYVCTFMLLNSLWAWQRRPIAIADAMSTHRTAESGRMRARAGIIPHTDFRGDYIEREMEDRHSV